MIKILLSLLLILAVQSQTLQVGTDPSTPPFTYLQDGTNVGFDIDLFAAVAKVGNLQYEWVNLPWTDLFQAVLNETIDLADSGITINDARKLIYDFSVPYFLSTHVILAPADTKITKAQDLVDLNIIVGVQNGTTGAFAVEKIFGGPSANIKNYTTAEEMLQALQAGDVDAAVHDSGILENFNNKNPGYTIIRDPDVFAIEFYGYMFPKGSTLVPEFNAAITAVLKSGDYSTIYETWFGSTPDVAILLAAGEDEDPYDIFNEEAVFGEEGLIGEEEGWVAEAELYDITLLL